MIRFRVVFGLRHEFKLNDTAGDFKPGRTQVFVYSYRDKLWFLQDPLTEDGRSEVVLGDYGHFSGRYKVVAVKLTDKPVGGYARLVLPEGEQTPPMRFLRIGF